MVIECIPEVSEEVVKVAWPPLNVPLPRDVDPSRKFTVPVGVPEAGATGVTVAVRVTDWPTAHIPEDGLQTRSLAEATVVVVVPWLTVWLRAVDMLEAKLESPA